eukprot:scaffold89742_cov34-Attheya_sp.AAC.1
MPIVCRCSGTQYSVLRYELCEIRPQRKQGHDMGESGTRTERDGARAAGSRKRPTGPHNNKKVVVLGSMLGPSALFNMGYRQPQSVPVLRLTFCFAALVNISVLHEFTV